ncbi:hypothetical protein L837_0394 [Mycobacterium avium MAV_061107_1842]|nr:hypothetical protein L837_0394 [Mycobacterium avium MAV_061107_1842]
MVVGHRGRPEPWPKGVGGQAIQPSRVNDDERTVFDIDGPPPARPSG